MEILRVIYECIKLYFVYKELNKKGFIKTDYSLISLIKTGLRHKDTFYSILEPLNKKKEEFNEKKQSEEETVC